jgi:hypothetical protein
MGGFHGEVGTAGMVERTPRMAVGRPAVAVWDSSCSVLEQLLLRFGAAAVVFGQEPSP